MKSRTNLQEYFENQGVRQVDICNILGKSKAQVSNYLSGKIPFGKKSAKEWSTAFGLSESWLLTGEGPMLASDIQQRPIYNNEKGEVLKVPIQGAATQTNNNSPHSVMFAQNVNYRQDTAGGIEIESVAENSYPVIPLALTKKPDIDVLATLRNENIQGVEYLNCAMLFADIDAFFRVEDEAMCPFFQKGDLVALRGLAQDAFIINGNAYVVDTKSNGLIFRILIDREQNLECHALGDKERYVNFMIPKEQIYRIFKVMGIIRACV